MFCIDGCSITGRQKSCEAVVVLVAGLEAQVVVAARGEALDGLCGMGKMLGAVDG